MAAKSDSDIPVRDTERRDGKARPPRESKSDMMTNMSYDAFTRIYQDRADADRGVRVANVWFWIAMAAAAGVMMSIGF